MYVGRMQRNVDYFLNWICEENKVCKSLLLLSSESVSSPLLSKTLQIKLCKTILLSLVLYGCEMWSLTSKEELKLQLFQNKGLRRIFAPKKNRILHNEELLVLTSHLVSLGWWRKGSCNGLVTWLGSGKQWMHTGFCCGNLLENVYMEKERERDGSFTLRLR
jgi:hypothetical protein